MKQLAFAVLLVASSAFAADNSALDAVFGRPGSALPGGVYKFGFPRSDLHVTVGAVDIKPALALGSWAAFKGNMTMGDLVLGVDEVAGVISALEAGGIDVTAVHNHLLHETPQIVYVHFDGHGDRVALAKTLRAALEKTKTPLAAPAAPAATSSLDLPTSELDRILGVSGKANGGVDQFSVPRAGKITAGGMEIPPSMGTATAINFQPTGNGRAVTTGDFVLIATEVNPAIRALRAGGIEVTALHSHMLTEQPRLFFMHFWGDGDATALATSLRRALDVMNVKR